MHVYSKNFGNQKNTKRKQITHHPTDLLTIKNITFQTFNSICIHIFSKLLSYVCYRCMRYRHTLDIYICVVFLLNGEHFLHH